MPRPTRPVLLAALIIVGPLTVFAAAALPAGSTRFKKTPFASARKVDRQLRDLRCALEKICARVGANIAAIAANRDAIAENQGAIMESRALIGVNQLAVADNQAAIASASAGLSANAALIGSNASAIADNQAAIAANAAAIAALQGDGDDEDDDDGGDDPSIVFSDDFERPDSDTIGEGWVSDFGQNSVANGELQLVGHNGAGDGGRALGDPEVRRCVGFRPDFDLFVTVRIDDIATRIHMAVNIPTDKPNRSPRQLFISSDPPSPNQFLVIRDFSGSALVSAPVTMSPGVRYRVRLTYRAGVMSAKLWPEAAPEPEAYQVSTPYETSLGQNLVLGANISGVTTRTWQYDDVVLKN